MIAEADYAASVELDPSNEALQRDLVNVRNEKAKLKSLPPSSSPTGSSERPGFMDKVASAC